MKKRNRIHSQLLLLFLSIVFYSFTYAQQKEISRADFLNDYVFKGNHFQVDFAALSVVKARMRKITGDYPASSKAALGFAFGLKYKINFNNDYSLVVGPDATIMGRTFITSFKKEDFSPPLIRDYVIKGIESYVPDLVIGLPVMFEKRWFSSKTSYRFAGAGLKLSFSTGADLDISSISLQNVNNDFFYVGSVEVYANNDAKPWFSIPLQAGQSWLLKNNNLLQLAISANISFTKYVNGIYEIDIPGKPLTTGSYSSTGSFIGLSFNYVFTSANYRIRKAYEKRNQL